jgi:hypothetical protein
MAAPVSVLTLASHAAGKKGHTSITLDQGISATPQHRNQKRLQETVFERAARGCKLFRAEV